MDNILVIMKVCNGIQNLLYNVAGIVLCKLVLYP